MPFRRVGRPGLIGLAARTAVTGASSIVTDAGVPQSVSWPTAPSAGRGGSDVSAELEQLVALNDRGVLSDEEFAVAKARLLT